MIYYLQLYSEMRLNDFLPEVLAIAQCLPYHLTAQEIGKTMRRQHVTQFSELTSL